MDLTQEETTLALAPSTRIRTIAMENPGAASLTDAARLVQLLKIGGYSATRSTRENSCKVSSRWHVDGYEWEVRVCPDYSQSSGMTPWVALELVLLTGSSSASHTQVRSILSCRLVDPRGILKPSEEKSKFWLFSVSTPVSSMLKLIKREDLESSSYLQDDAFTLQCTITVLRELPVQTFPAVKRTTVREVPSSNLHLQLGELLQSEAGADVVFVVSGESFSAHKLILAARSPVFMAQFLGQMMEKSSQRVEVKDMEAAVFRALLRFVYTDTVSEFDLQHEDKEEEAASTTGMAQHLLAAADRYGVERLKLICEGKLSGCIDVDTAAATLSLAELHGCEQLKARCIDFIVRSPAVLDAVLATEGYKNLEASCPSVFTDLLRRATEKNLV